MDIFDFDLYDLDFVLYLIYIMRAVTTTSLSQPPMFGLSRVTGCRVLFHSEVGEELLDMFLRFYYGLFIFVA